MGYGFGPDGADWGVMGFGLSELHGFFNNFGPDLDLMG